jgi:hypothetical protein
VKHPSTSKPKPAPRRESYAAIDARLHSAESLDSKRAAWKSLQRLFHEPASAAIREKVGKK